MPEIERVRGIELAEFKSRFDLPEVPVVIEGGCAHYRAVKSWTPDYLKQRLGHEEIQYKLSTTHQHPNFHAKTVPEMFARGGSTLAKFLDDVTTGERSERSRRYFTGDERFLLKRRDGQETRDEALAPLLDDVEVPALLPADRLYTVWGWLSGGGVRTWLHYETNGCHNFNAQLAGKKTCVLYPPEQLPKMRLFRPGSGNPAYNCSEIDVEDPAEQPALSAAQGLSATIEAGDLLFIPAWWFHTFFHLGEFNANINFWWKPERPSLNQVAVRQGFLDAMLASGFSEKNASAAEAELLARVEQAIVTRS
jgi:Cupin-like domain